MTAKKKTGSRVSSIASKLLRMNDEAIWSHFHGSPADAHDFCADIRSMAASLLSQDEVPKP